MPGWADVGLASRVIDRAARRGDPAKDAAASRSAVSWRGAGGAHRRRGIGGHGRGALRVVTTTQTHLGSKGRPGRARTGKYAQGVQRWPFS